jgi:hypothetical protein
MYPNLGRVSGFTGHFVFAKPIVLSLMKKNSSTMGIDVHTVIGWP